MCQPIRCRECNRMFIPAKPHYHTCKACYKQMQAENDHSDLEVGSELEWWK